MRNKIIDFHMHPFSGSMENLCHYKDGFDKDSKESRRYMEKAEIGHICGSVLDGCWPEMDFKHVRRLNQSALKLWELYGGFYTPGIHIHPGFVRESCEEVRIMAEKGVKLIGELVPYLHGWSNREDEGLMEILAAVKNYDMVVSYHSEPDFHMEKMIEAYPEISFVAAHPGEKPRVEQHIEDMKKYENLYLDLSGTGLHRFGVVKYLIDRVGADRILFGTDYPICNPGMYVAAVRMEEISEQEREKIFHENAEKLLGI